MSTIAYLNQPAWVTTELRPSPRLGNSLKWLPVDAGRHLVREAVEVHRDRIFGDLFRKLAPHPPARGSARV